MSAVNPSPEERLMARRLAAVSRAAAAGSIRRTLFLVIREPDMAALVRGLAHWVEGLSADDRQAWWANFTKLRIFAGHPARAAVAALLDRTESDTVGFALVDADTRHPRLADLLVPLRTRGGPAPGSVRDVHWGSGEGNWELEVDVEGIDWPRYLVHVTHLLAEAALEDAGFGGHIRLRHRIGPPVCGDDALQARLEIDAQPPVCRAVLRPSARAL